MRAARAALTAVMLLPAVTRAQSVRLQPASRFGYDSSTVSISRPPARLVGTLLKPRDVSRPPVVLFVSGAGPVNRDGNVAGAPGRTDAIRVLAESLAVRGIASVRFDKRGVGASERAALPEHEMRFEVFAHDVATWVWDLERRAFGPIVVAGHDEGAFVGLLSRRDLPASAYVLLNGTGQRADRLLRDQLTLGQPAPFVATVDSLLGAMRADSVVDRVPIGLSAVFRPTVQPYLMSWMRFDPAEEMARVTEPCLIVSGRADARFAADADTLVKAQPHCVRATVDSMSHTLKRGPRALAEQRAAWTDPREPLAPGLVEAVAGFIELLTTRAPARCTSDSAAAAAQRQVLLREVVAPAAESPVLFDGQYLGRFASATMPAGLTDSIASAVLMTREAARRYGPAAARCGALLLRSGADLAADSAEVLAAVWQAEQAAHAARRPVALSLFDSVTALLVTPVLQRELRRRGVPIATSGVVGDDSVLVTLRQWDVATTEDGIVARVHAHAVWTERSVSGAAPCRMRSSTSRQYAVRRLAGKWRAVPDGPVVHGDSLCRPLDPSGP